MRAELRPAAPRGVSLQLAHPEALGHRVSRAFATSGSIDRFDCCLRPILRHPLSRRLDSAVFERVYHDHQWPSLGRYRAITGSIPEHRVWLNTQKGAPFATAFIAVAHATSGWAVVPLLVGGLISSAVFGMRKGIHQHISNRRALKAAQKDLPALEPPPPTVASPELLRERAAGLAALARLRSQERWRARVALLTIGGLAPLASTMTTLDIFFKPAILGHLVPALAAAAFPLAVATMPVLAGAALLNGVFDLVGVWRMGSLQNRMDTAQLEPWLGVEDGVMEQVRARIRMVRKYGLYSGVASVGVAVGAPITFALGPVGLSVLLPSVLATIWIAYERSNRLDYHNTLNDEQKLALGSSHAVANEVYRAEQHYLALKALKAARRTYYPFGSDSPVGMVPRFYAWARRSARPPERPRWQTARESVLSYWMEHLDIETGFQQRRLTLVQQELARPLEPGRLGELQEQQMSAIHKLRQADGMREVVRDIAAGAPDAAEIVDHLHALMEDTGLLHAFASHLLDDKALLAVLDERGFDHAGRRWSVDPEIIEDSLEHHLDADAQTYVLQRYWCHAEEVLLKRGKRRFRDRMRELLDYLTVSVDVTLS